MKKNLLSLLILSFLALTTAFAQTRKLTGTVTSADDGQPIPGVSVTIVGSKTGTLTDFEGKFIINAGPNDQSLQFKFVGFTTVTMPITSTTNYLVKISADTKQLNEVVITDSYGSQAKKAYTGAANVVSADVLNDKPYTGLQTALQGQVPGLNVTSNNGAPGANVQIRLRGQGSIGLDSNPLYVIDGVIINSGDLSRLTVSSNVLAGLNDDDIESVTVLKDASATSIYGSRGANGVIIISTKKGKSGKTTVTMDVELGSTNNIAPPAGGLPASADLYSNLFLTGLANAAVTPQLLAALPATTATDITAYGLFQPGTNWYDAVNKNGKQQQYNISVRGGSDMTKISASAGYFKQESTVIGSQLNRITGLLNIDQTVNKRISLQINMNGSNVNQNTPLDGSSFGGPEAAAFFLRPTQQAYNADGTLNIGTSNTAFPGFYNPLFIVANDKKLLAQTRLLTNITGKYNIWQNLNYTSTVGIDYDALEEQQYNNPSEGDSKGVGREYDYYTRYYNWTLRNQLDYRYDIPKIQNFYVDAAIGYEAQRSQGYFISAEGTGYPATQPLLTASANASTPALAQATISNYTFDSFYSRGSINYQNKYVVTGSFRRDGSSRFGTVQKEGNFSAIGGTWNVDQESFFTKQNILTSAKLRGSYGTVGNAGNGSGSLTNYSAQPTAGYGASYAGAPGQNFSTIGNIYITWETTKELDLGTDLGFFKDRLTLSFDYYNRNTDGLIQSAPIPRTTGFSSIAENIGAIRNRGEEFSITGIPVKTKDFKWSTNFNIALNRNTVEKLLNDAPIYVGNQHEKEGADLYTWSLPLSAGVNPANGEQLWYTDATKTTTTNAYNANLRQDEYQADPKYFGGWSNTFSYKGITLTADFYYSGGNYIFDTWSFYLNDGTQYTYGKYAANAHAWNTPGQITNVPKYIDAGATQTDGYTAGNSSSASTRFLYKGDYIRLKNLQAGYNFSNVNYLKKIGISKLYIYGRGTNVWTKTFDKNLPFDPEVGITGSSNLEIPQVRTFTVGLNVGF